MDSNDKQSDIDRFIEDLLVEPFDVLAQLPYVDRVVQARKRSHVQDCARIAAVAIMLASEEACGITGQAINIDGGAVVY